MSQSGAKSRLERRFAELKAEGRGGLISFTTAGDPTFDSSLELVRGLPDAGVDVIELGMPFSDPMADGPAIQASSLRALGAGMTLAKTLDLVSQFRDRDADTPIILMGYYNPIYSYGAEKFLLDAKESGVDGLIIVDLPPEEDAELCLPALKADIHWIRLATPTTDDKRLPAVLANSSGFVYYVSIMGITGTRTVQADAVRVAVERLKRHTELPIAVGFGIKTPEHAANIARVADAAVVGSAIVERIKNGLDAKGLPRPSMVSDILGFVRALAAGVRKARDG